MPSPLLAAALFSTAFGAMLLSIVLWLQDDWHWSALRAGLAVFPGPLMVPGLSILLRPPVTALRLGRA